MMKRLTVILVCLAFFVSGAPALAAPQGCEIEPSGTRPKGAIVFNSDHNVLQYCDGTAWKAIAWNLGGEGCFGEWEARESDRNWSGVASSDDGMKLVATVANGFIYVSADGGATWAERASSRNWVDVASSADGTKLVAVVANGRPYASTDSGATWVQQDTVNRNWRAVASSADGMKLVGVVGSGRVYTSANGGGTWQQQDSADRAWSDVASSADGVKLVGGTDGGVIYTSSDSGVTWVPRAGTIAFEVASSTDGSVLAGVNFSSRIVVSADSGTSWTLRDVEAAWAGIASSADGTRLVAIDYEWDGARKGPVYVSLDGGANWQARGMNVAWRDIAMSADGKKAVAVSSGNGETGKIYTSFCNGVSSGGVPDCANDSTSRCMLDADRGIGDPEFIAANVASGVNILGVTGMLTGGAPDCTNDATATCTLDADRDSGDPQLVAANIASGVNILGVTGSLVAPAVPTAADGYFVLTSNFWNGNLGGLSGANAKCLSALTATAWKNKAVASANGQLVSGKVRAFLCDGTTCQNGQPNTKYFFATALDAIGGGDSFTTNASGQGPNNSDLWGQATRLTGGDEIPSYWSGRAQTGTTLWPSTSHASRCNAWASSAGGQSGMTGRANTSDGGNTRWAVATGTCDDDFHLLCFVDP